MAYIIKVETHSRENRSKILFITCANRFRAKRAIRDTMEIVEKTAECYIRVDLLPSLIGESVYRRLSHCIIAEK